MEEKETLANRQHQRRYDDAKVHVDVKVLVVVKWLVGFCGVRRQFGQA